MTETEYNDFLSSVKEAKAETKLTDLQRRRLKRFDIFSVGQSVRVPIPNVDRGRGDSRNILMSIVEVNGDMYKLANEKGTIKERFSRNQFTPCDADLVDAKEISEEEKSLRQLAREQSMFGGQGYTRCNCKQECKTNRCKCKSSGMLCNSKCNCKSCKNK